MDWDGDESNERPTYMRRDAFVPCDCKVCFFCKHGLTGVIRGVDKKKRKAVLHYKIGGRKEVVGCTEVRVPLGRGSQLCRMCYRNQSDTLSKAEKKKMCATSTMGCNQCQEHICKKCWAQGYDRHQK